MIYDDTFTYIVRGYYFAQVKCINAQVCIRGDKNCFMQLSQLPSKRVRKLLHFTMITSLPRKILRSQQLWRYQDGLDFFSLFHSQDSCSSRGMVWQLLHVPSVTPRELIGSHLSGVNSGLSWSRGKWPDGFEN